MELNSTSHCVAIPGLQANGYGRHALHDASRIWPEKNCYVDLWIEILHARGLQPAALLPFTITVDFEDDQWTFFKPSHDELRSLFGVKVHELTVWRPLVEHVIEHVKAGRLVSLEVDAYWLPDTQGTDYQHKHSKTTIAINEVDLTNETVGYFHNAAYFEAYDTNFRQLLKLDVASPELPLFAELISFYPPPSFTQAQLQQASLALMRKQIQYIPAINPIERFAQRFAADLPQLQASGLENYHAWAFAGIRQWGSACELTGEWIAWMNDALPPGAAALSEQFAHISKDAKTLILKGARAVMSKKPFDPVLQLQGAAGAWSEARDALKQLIAHA